MISVAKQDPVGATGASCCTGSSGGLGTRTSVDEHVLEADAADNDEAMRRFEDESRNRTLDLWRLDLALGSPGRLTFHPSHDIFPLWSPDGSRIAFASVRDPPLQLYELNANSAGIERRLLKTSFPAGPSGWSADGNLLIYQITDPQTGGDIWALSLTGKAEPHPVVYTSADEHYGTLSPDGRWLAYISNETGT